MVVGDYEVDALLDAEGSFATYAEAFPHAGDDDWAPWRDRHPELFDGDRWRLPFRSYLIRGGGRTILVDTGVGPSGGGEFLPERQGGCPVSSSGWARPRTWSSSHGMPLVAHRESIALSSERGRSLTRATAVEGEAELAPGVVAFDTQGHLPGHMSVRVGDELVILGDVAVHPAQLARPGLVYVSDVGADTREGTVRPRRPDPGVRSLPRLRLWSHRGRDVGGSLGQTQAERPSGNAVGSVHALASR